MERTFNLEVRQYKIKDADEDALTISTPDDVVKCFQEDYNPIQEEMYAAFLNVRNKVVEKILIAKGGYNTLYATPLDVLRPIVLCNANRMILAHNHPSGDVSPSEEDILFTNKVEKAAKMLGILLLDHVVYSETQYYSFKKEGLLN